MSCRSGVSLNSVLLASFAAMLFLVSPSCAEQVRIGLTRYKNLTSISISATGDYRVATPDGKIILTAERLDRVTVELQEKGLRLISPTGTTSDVGQSVWFEPASSNSRLFFAPTRMLGEYRGRIEIRHEEQCLMPINELDVEEYLLGVVALEMPAKFELEALKAQAVAARTFAVANASKHSKSGYGLCDSGCCQIYWGSAFENETASAAVRATQGRILTYKGQTIEAFYSADCGGYTACRITSKGPAIPYLESRPDRAGDGHPDFCAASPLHTWTKTYTPAGLEQLLREAEIAASRIKAVRVSSTTQSGRAADVEITCAEGSVTISGENLRRALGLKELNSTLFTVKADPEGSFTFDGKGWGHGAGLCQYGANGMASPPYNYTFEQILAHYYPGAKLKSTSPRPLKPAEPRKPQSEEKETSPPIAVEDAAKPALKAPKGGTWPWSF